MVPCGLIFTPVQGSNHGHTRLWILVPKNRLWGHFWDVLKDFPEIIEEVVLVYFWPLVCPLEASGHPNWSWIAFLKSKYSSQPSSTLHWAIWPKKFSFFKFFPHQFHSIPPPPLHLQIKGSWGPVLGLIHPRAKKYPKIHLIFDFSPKKNPFYCFFPKKQKFP